MQRVSEPSREEIFPGDGLFFCHEIHVLRTFVYFSIDKEHLFWYYIENEQMFREVRTMTKKYRVVSKFRFTIFMTLFILIAITAVGTMLGFNTVSSSSKDLYNQVQIESGDTLWDIAVEYGPEDSDVRKTVREICDLNQISADQLHPGQKIIVPVYE